MLRRQGNKTKEASMFSQYAGKRLTRIGNDQNRKSENVSVAYLPDQYRMRLKSTKIAMGRLNPGHNNPSKAVTQPEEIAQHISLSFVFDRRATEWV